MIHGRSGAQAIIEASQENLASKSGEAAQEALAKVEQVQAAIEEVVAARMEESDSD